MICTRSNELRGLHWTLVMVPSFWLGSTASTIRGRPPRLPSQNLAPCSCQGLQGSSEWRRLLQSTCKLGQAAMQLAIRQLMQPLCQPHAHSCNDHPLCGV